MKAAILSIGDELVSGRIADTNAAWLARSLATLGVECAEHRSLADDCAGIATGLVELSGRVDLVIGTGGLGPTPDDLTRQALADALGCELELHEPSYERIKSYFEQRKRRMHEINRVQAMIPAKAEALDNSWGTAPGMTARLNNAAVFLLPGVPHEMMAMFEAAIRPRLQERAAGKAIVQHTLNTFGMSEAEIGARLGDLMTHGRNPSVGTGASELVIAVRFTARGSSQAGARGLLNTDIAEVRNRLGTVVFGEGSETLSDAVGQLLLDRGSTISVAESCTGGLIAKRLTDLPGSSAYFRQGFVTYSNESKTQWLGIPSTLIESEGAVSAAVAQAMAAGCRERAGTDYAISATGIAGPGGGSPEKPVGLVYIAVADGNETTVKELLLGDQLSRRQVRDRTVKAVLNLIRLKLVKS